MTTYVQMHAQMHGHADVHVEPAHAVHSGSHVSEHVYGERENEYGRGNSHVEHVYCTCVHALMSCDHTDVT